MEKTALGRRLLAAVAVISVLVLTAGSALARTVENPHILSKRTVKLLASFSDLDGAFPKELASDHDVFVVVYATAVSSDVYLLARPTVGPEQLARALESAVKDTQFAREAVRYTAGRGFSWADVWVDRHRMFLQRAETRQPVGAIIGRLKEQGLRPHAVLCVRKSARISHRLNLSGFSGRKWRVFDVSSVAPGFDFRVQGQMSFSDLFVVCILALMVPAAGIGGVPMLIHIARLKRRTPEGRRALFRGWYFYLMLGCTCASMAILSRRLHSGWLYGFQDLWFGDHLSWQLLAMVLSPVSGLIFFIPLSWITAWLAFPGRSEAGSWKPWRTSHIGVLTTALIAAAVVLRLCRHLLPRGALLVRHEVSVLVVSWLLAEYVWQRLARNRVRLRGPAVPDESLHSRFSALAFGLGMSVKRVDVVDAVGRSRARPNLVMRRDGVLFVSRELVEKLSPEELDFFALHEFAHVSGRHRAKAAACLGLGTLLALIPGALFVIRPLDLSVENWTLWATALGLLLLIGDGMWFGRRREQGADRMALGLTRDAGTAVQAVMKASGMLEQPANVRDLDTRSVDLLASLRVNWLRKAVKQMGLETGDAFGRSEEDAALTYRTQEVASRVGVKVNKVEIVQPPAGRPFVNAGALTRGRVIVGRGLTECFGSDELDFILAHELAHLKHRDVPKMLASLFVDIISVFAFAFFAFVQGIRPETALIVLPGTLLMIANTTWLSRRRELAADRTALRVTRNLPAALSALKKLHSHNPIVVPEEMESYMTHPKESYRLQALQREAKALGLGEG